MELGLVAIMVLAILGLYLLIPRKEKKQMDLIRIYEPGATWEPGATFSKSNFWRDEEGQPHGEMISYRVVRCYEDHILVREISRHPIPFREKE